MSTRTATAHGHSAIDAMIAAAQAQFPAYRLNLVSGIEAHNNFARFSWAAGGSKEAPLYLGGTDFATLAHGRPDSSPWPGSRTLRR